MHSEARQNKRNFGLQMSINVFSNQQKIKVNHEKNTQPFVSLPTPLLNYYLLAISFDKVRYREHT